MPTFEDTGIEEDVSCISSDLFLNELFGILPSSEEPMPTISPTDSCQLHQPITSVCTQHTLVTTPATSTPQPCAVKSEPHTPTIHPLTPSHGGPSSLTVANGSYYQFVSPVKPQFKTAEEVVRQNPQYCNKETIGRLAVLLAKHSFFGDDVLQQSGEKLRLAEMKCAIRNLVFPIMSVIDFEEVWIKCLTSIANCCKYQTVTKFLSSRLSLLVHVHVYHRCITSF